MKYILKNLTIPVLNDERLVEYIKKSLNNQYCYINQWKVIKKAIDTRKKDNPLFVYTIELSTDKELVESFNLYKQKELPLAQYTKKKLSDISPFIIGMGPAGLFCALSMVEKGLKPHLFDQGDCLEKRSLTVTNFWTTGKLNANSNVQFGEGGAGAFSDGKLTSRTSNYFTQNVFDLLVRFVADENIKYDAHPHLGTDLIRLIVKDIRDYLIAQGCVFHYNSRLEKISIINKVVSEVIIKGLSYKPECLVLALGNSARETYYMLHRNSVTIEPKPFSIGFRISHPQKWINESVYGSDGWSPILGAASYRLTSNRSGTYTFCMCPGGYIISAGSEPGTLVTNGMSYRLRNGKYGNSAIVTNIDSKIYGTDLFGGIIFQESIEKSAFIDNYAAPYQKVDDYMKGYKSDKTLVDALFSDYSSYNISDLFSKSINNSLKEGLKHFNKILPGFIKDGLLIAPETRTSCPIRIIRDESALTCKDIFNLYAIGEGSGYAGGIISSAADGYKIGSTFTL